MHIRESVLALLFAAAVVPGAEAMSVPSHIYVCSGYGCAYKTRLVITDQMRQRFVAIMRGGHGSAAEEQAAIAKAVQYFEELVTKTIGVADKPKGEIGGARVKGQMDCIDESTNTRVLLDLLDRLKLLRHHRVEGNASRGFFLDQRYPHATAVIKAPDGTRWAVDSWYEPAGGPPDIMPLERWRQRGVLGER
ncbi:hypothetical protein [Chelativorans salis]|uniref:Uncharacterized protein n=1 Tax=Chelativorans salis TaxID=2978478 RepID=A0ABT2LPN1_9HYPH|nr:hypothetical protein [Chelativorans sp. EGI FJ00035]MCT7375348.1 hypothetical protein [Chelativorans sp. EGI FJ00035]